MKDNNRTNIMLSVEQESVDWFREECINISQFMRKCMREKKKEQENKNEKGTIFKQTL